MTTETEVLLGSTAGVAAETEALVSRVTAGTDFGARGEGGNACGLFWPKGHLPPARGLLLQPLCCGNTVLANGLKIGDAIFAYVTTTREMIFAGVAKTCEVIFPDVTINGEAIFPDATINIEAILPDVTTTDEIIFARRVIVTAIK